MMWIAELETRHFSFMAVGKTEAQTGKVLAALWEEHCDVYQIAPYGPLFRNPKDLREQSAFTQVKIGEGYVDHHRIVTDGHLDKERRPGYRRSGAAA